jgi:two-component system response regulator FimZ (fimbrial Z protein)/two-component system response regulator EvgA
MRNKVMLVDDHPAMLMAMKAMLLNQILFEVVGQAQNGEECLNEIKKSNPDILILDLDMPKTDGFDLIRRISISHPK